MGNIAITGKKSAKCVGGTVPSDHHQRERDEHPAEAAGGQGTQARHGKGKWFTLAPARYLLCESEVSAYFLNQCSRENMRFLQSYSVFNFNIANCPLLILFIKDDLTHK